MEKQGVGLESLHDGIFVCLSLVMREIVSVTKNAPNSCNILELYNINFLEGAVAHGRTSSILAFAPLINPLLFIEDIEPVARNG